MDEREEHVETAMQPCWFQQEIYAHNAPGRPSNRAISSPFGEKAAASEKTFIEKVEETEKIRYVFAI